MKTIFLPFRWPSMARPAGRIRGRKGGRRGEGRDGIGGTWVSKGAGKVDSG